MQEPATVIEFDADRMIESISQWAGELGFQGVGIARFDLEQDERHLDDWLARGRHGVMEYMARHGHRRGRPDLLVPGTRSVIVARMAYLPEDAAAMRRVLAAPSLGYISRYALGRDYHKLLRRRLQQLADRISDAIGPFGYRVFSDSAPVLEKPLARNAGLGWIGKHTNLIDRHEGSWFFLGEIYTDLPLPPTATEARTLCGSCTRCIAACPSGAIVAPYRIDARRCISYLTIELRGPIPRELRSLLGNRIYGCDDCQLACPWNRRARLGAEPDFRARHGLDATSLIALFRWSETDFFRYTEGSAIRRIGYSCWLRNVAVALGNAPGAPVVIAALQSRTEDPDLLVREHVQWALERQTKELTC